MDLFDRYCLRNIIYPKFIESPPSKNLSLIVVIPAFCEPGIVDTLKSLELSAVESGKIDAIEVIIVVNSGEHATEEELDLNRECIEAVNSFISPLNVHLISLEKIRRKWAGVGYARKVGMDEAVRRFGMSVGAIVSLDADTLVSLNYFSELLSYDLTKEGAAVIKFKHQNLELNRAIYLYELHLRYYRNALKWSGYDNYFYTIGSAFIVDSLTYIKVGGMNRRQGGEDFYFLHKVAEHREVREINRCSVFPSSRVSNRVPFGTGPEIDRINRSGGMFSYDFNLFKMISCFISLKREGRLTKDVVSESIPILGQFLDQSGFWDQLDKLKKHSGDKDLFINLFNGFQVVKFLNFAERNGFPKKPIEDCVAEFREELDLDIEQDSLDYLRELDYGYN